MLVPGWARAGNLLSRVFFPSFSSPDGTGLGTKVAHSKLKGSWRNLSPIRAAPVRDAGTDSRPIRVRLGGAPLSLSCCPFPSPTVPTVWLLHKEGWGSLHWGAKSKQKEGEEVEKEKEEEG